MELRIDFNNRRKQFAGIGRDHLCDFQDGIQYKFPYSVCYGQFERIANDIPEKSPEVVAGAEDCAIQAVAAVGEGEAPKTIAVISVFPYI